MAHPSDLAPTTRGRGRSRRPLAVALAAAAALAAAPAAHAVPGHAAATRPAPHVGRWAGTADDSGVKRKVAFKIVRTRTGYELRDFSVKLGEVCADAAGTGPPVPITGAATVAKVRITRAGRFAIEDGDSSLHGKVASRGRITGRAEVAPVGLTCSFGSASFTAAPVVDTVTVRSSGRSVVLTPGDRLVVDVAENPSTGFAWKTISRPSVLGLVSTKYTPDPAPAGVVGAGGRRVIIYEARRTGRGRLTLRYGRPFAPSTSDRRFTVKVRVRR